MIDTKPRIKPCEDCIDPEWNPGYHIRSGEVPYKAHDHLDPLQFKQPLMLDVGAGHYSTIEGFTAVDLYTECDINAPMWSIPLPDGSVDGIACSNALEHVQKSMVVPTLREFNRLLKVGGKLEIMVPDLEWSCEFFLKNPGIGWQMDIIYGNQNHGGEFHLTGFTREIIAHYFAESIEDKKTAWYIESISHHFGEDSLEDLGPYEGNPEVRQLSHKVTQRVIVVKADKI